MNIELKDNQKKILSRIPICILRSSLFSFTNRLEEKKLKKEKVIYEDKDFKIIANGILSQKHKDLLFVLMSKEAFSSYDGYIIPISLYKIAKELKYNNPNKRIDDVKKLIDGLKNVSLKIFFKEKKQGFTFRLINNYFFDNNLERYVIHIDNFAKIFIFGNKCIVINDIIKDKLLSVKDPNLKGIITWVISNKTDYKLKLKDFIKSSNLVGYQKTRFLKALRENKEFLKDEFQIEFNEEEGIVTLLDKQVEFYYPQKKQNLLTNLATLKDKKENKSDEIISNQNENEENIQENETPQLENKVNELDKFIGLTITLIGEEVQVIDIQDNKLIALKKDGSQITQTFPNRQVLINFLKRFKGDNNE